MLSATFHRERTKCQGEFLDNVVLIYQNVTNSAFLFRGSYICINVLSRMVWPLNFILSKTFWHMVALAFNRVTKLLLVGTLCIDTRTFPIRIAQYLTSVQWVSSYTTYLTLVFCRHWQATDAGSGLPGGTWRTAYPAVGQRLWQV